MTHNMTPDSLVDLKFIMADTGFGKTFIYDRVKDGTLVKPKKIHGRSRWRYSDHCEFKNRLLSSSNG
ncbi:helix-turn-helix transcriptional regulator [Edwardsiella tarda]|uniref:helix-turn-helix transcriptional regulator n=1 Tax=Edwardsiella tarda TaxID=636 RepID=UPI00351C0A32